MTDLPTPRERLDRARELAGYSLNDRRSRDDVELATMHAVLAVAEHLLTDTDNTGYVEGAGWGASHAAPPARSDAEAAARARHVLLAALGRPTTPEDDTTARLSLAELADMAVADHAAARNTIREAMGDRYRRDLPVSANIERLARDTVEKLDHAMQVAHQWRDGSVAVAAAAEQKRDATARDRDGAVRRHDVVKDVLCREMGVNYDDGATVAANLTRLINTQDRQREQLTAERDLCAVRVDRYRRELTAQIGFESVEDIDEGIVRDHTPRT